jgi:hypothetical protein
MGFHSGLELDLSKQIKAATGKPANYEGGKIEYVKPERKAKYTWDFKLPNGIIIESKGRFVTADRQKHLLIKAQHPAIDLRFVFNNPNSRISKTSATTYAMWCEKNGFQYSKGLIPESWFTERKQ